MCDISKILWKSFNILTNYYNNKLIPASKISNNVSVKMDYPIKSYIALRSLKFYSFKLNLIAFESPLLNSIFG